MYGALLACQARTATRALTALPALLFSRSGQPTTWPLMQQSARGLCSTEQQDRQDAQSAEEYKGVRRAGRKWQAVIFISSRVWPGTDKLHYINTLSSAEQAAAAADLYSLALYGSAIEARHLNFPAENHSQELITAARQVLEAKYPGLSAPVITDDSPRIHPTRLTRTNIYTIAARVAKVAAACHDSSTGFCGVFKRVGQSGYQAAMTVGRYMTYTVSGLKTSAEAAVVYDLVRYNLYGPKYTVNFPPHIYTDSDAAVVRQDMQHRYPGMLAAAMRPAARQPPCTYQLTMAGKTLDAAVEAVEATAETAKECTEHNRQGIMASGHIFSLLLGETADYNKRIYHSRCYASALAAAADMIRQALGRPAVNLPASITAAGVPAAKVWVELNRTRLTVEKQHWASRAAVSGTA